MIHTDGKQTIANAPALPSRKSETKLDFYRKLDADRKTRIQVVYGYGLGGERKAA